MHKMKVRTAVANLWRSPDAPRPVDWPMLAQPAKVRTWLQGMNHDERLALTADNLLQSQALYGTEVEVLERQGEWYKVIIADQPSSEDGRGYPGWMIGRQLQESQTEDADGPFAVICRPTAWLYGNNGEKEQEVSFQTRFPFEYQNGNWMTVRTLSGIAYVQREDVLLENDEGILSDLGQQIVRAGEQFLGLPYLWAGMSGFGYDCSGFVHMMYRSVGLTIPRDSGDQAQEGQCIKRQDLEPGDLLFFASEEGTGSVHHVAIYYGDGKMMHAPNTGKAIEIIHLAASKYEVELWGARRYGKAHRKASK